MFNEREAIRVRMEQIDTQINRLNGEYASLFHRLREIDVRDMQMAGSEAAAALETPTRPTDSTSKSNRKNNTSKSKRKNNGNRRGRRVSAIYQESLPIVVDILQKAGKPIQAKELESSLKENGVAIKNFNPFMRRVAVLDPLITKPYRGMYAYDYQPDEMDK